MTQPPAIRITQLGKYYGPRLETDGVLRPREAWRSLLSIAGITLQPADEDLQVTFAVAGHVLRDVTVAIEAGSVVCLAGPSGSGKSVLLQILAGAVPPTSGSVEIFAPVTSLLTIGDNLDQRLTAIENIQNAAAEAQVPADQRAQYAEDIIAFAELAGFEHVPLRTYSTGMLLRLSIALVLGGTPSIVLIDDVLGVGDIAFQAKCIDRLHSLRQAGVTLVLAFSDETLVQQLATRVITLVSGRIVGDTQSAQQLPAAAAHGAAAFDWHVLETLPENDATALRHVEVRVASEGNDTYLDLVARFETKSGGFRCRPLVAVATTRTVLFRSIYPDFVDVAEAGPFSFGVRVPTELLPNGTYMVGFSIVAVRDHAVYSLKASEAITLTVRREPDVADAGPLPLLSLRLPWEIEPVLEASA